MQWLNWFYILWAKYQTTPTNQTVNEIAANNVKNIGTISTYKDNSILTNEIESGSRMIHPKFEKVVLHNKKKIEEIIQKIEQH